MFRKSNRFIIFIIFSLILTIAPIFTSITYASPTSKQLTSFSFNGLVPTVDASINEINKTVSATVPFGTNIANLVATFVTDGNSVTISGVTQSSGVTSNDFTNPIIYRVTAIDSTTADYTITVTVSANPSKIISTFAFNGLTTPVNASIDSSSKTITATVPFGTNVTNLVATFSNTGSNVKVSGVTQISNTTANDFTNPLIYRVTANDNSTVDYNVTVFILPSSAKQITAFSFNGIVTPVTIDELNKTISVNVPFGTDITNLVAIFISSGNNVKISNTTQVSGTTANDFTNVVTYTVTANDNSTVNYNVTVAISPNAMKQITGFAFIGATANVSGVVNETNKTIAVTVPFGTNVTNLVAIFTSNGTNVKVLSTTQASGITVNNFTNPIAYTVTAIDNTTVDYLVTVIIAQNPVKQITAFAFNTITNASGIINENNKTIITNVPIGTDVTNLVATFTNSGSNVKVSGVTQVSGITTNNFINPVVYQVTAADNTTVNYTVIVVIASGNNKQITAFVFNSLSPPVSGTINEANKTITVYVPYGTNLTNLVATFISNGANVKISSTIQASGITANNFTSYVTYHVTASDLTSVDYIVSVITPTKQITSFTLNGLSPVVNGIINESSKTITLNVPFGTNITNLVPTFTSNGSSVTVGGVIQTNGSTSNNFTSPVIYRVTAIDSTTVDYTVTTNIINKEITAFSLSNLVSPIKGVIDNTNKTIQINVPFGTDVTKLIPNFTSNSLNVTVSGITQVSGTTLNDFTKALIYRVTASDYSYTDYIVTVNIGPENKTKNGFQVLTDGSIIIKFNNSKIIDLSDIETVTKFKIPPITEPFTLITKDVTINFNNLDKGTDANIGYKASTSLLTSIFVPLTGILTIDTPGVDKVDITIPITQDTINEANVYKITTSGADVVHSITIGNTKVIKNAEPGDYVVAKNVKNFTDISDHWASQEINHGSAKMIISGYSDGTFKPDATVTRAEFTAMLTRAIFNSKDNADTLYDDVDKTSWYYNAIALATKSGIVQGDNGKFNPNASISREEIATMLVSATEKFGKTLDITDQEQSDLISQYSDGKNISDWAKPYVAKAIKYKLLQGNGNNSITPNGIGTRAEAITFINRMVKQDNLE